MDSAHFHHKCVQLMLTHRHMLTASPCNCTSHSIVLKGSRNLAQKDRITSNISVSQNDSEIHADPNGNLERHEVWIADRVLCRRCSRYPRACDTFSGCGRMLQGFTDEVRKHAEQRISSRFILYILGSHDWALKNFQKGLTL